MTEHQVDFGPVVDAIHLVNHNMSAVSEQVTEVGAQVETVAREQADTRTKLEQFYEEFLNYVETDTWDKEVSTARQELTLVRQELQTTFGHYAEVRRHTTGILQALDAGIVTEETIRAVSEELMLNCPGYWLAPCVVALSAWISDDIQKALRALSTATGRDDSKASLFFALISKRARRFEACSRWLTRYFQIQNPVSMDREVVVMLDALANGVFGGGALEACSKVIDQWLLELEQQPGFSDEQRRRWAEVLGAMTPAVGQSEYPNLRKYSPTWPLLEATLAGVRRHRVVYTFLDQLFAGEVVVPPRLEQAVDDMLTSLVSNFDDEELPLKRKELYSQIVIEVDRSPGRAGAKKAAADVRYRAETESFKEQTSFTGMLTNSAMYPERYGATLATQRYAVSRSRQWIIAGFNDLIARDRAKSPREAALHCGSWQGTSHDGQNETQLCADLAAHYATRIAQAVDAIALSGTTWVVSAAGCLFALMFFAGGSVGLGLVILAAVGAYFYFQHQGLETLRLNARTALERERDEATRILQASLAELADLAGEMVTEDGRAAEVVDLLSSLSSTQFVLNRPEQARAVVA